MSTADRRLVATRQEIQRNPAQTASQATRRALYGDLLLPVGEERQLGYRSPVAFDNKHIWTTGLTEQQRYPIQHQTSYQIWDTIPPHFQGNHGRSLVGFHPNEADGHHVAAIRRELTHEARFDDD